MPFMNNIKELCLVPGKASGDIASFEAASAPLVSCICTINPVQSGSGEPSPSNIRPITGHDDVTITQKDGNNTIIDTTTITFPDTVYGASLDVGTGVLTIDRAIGDLGTLNWGYTNNRFYASVPIKYYSQGEIPNIICERYKTTSYTQQGTKDLACSSYAGYLYIRDSNYTIPADFKTAMSGVMIVYELATPTTTQLTPEQLNSILGENNFYHDGNGHIDITYIRRIN